MTLSRSDGLLWLGITFVFAFSRDHTELRSFNLKLHTLILILRSPRLSSHHVSMVRAQPKRLRFSHGSRRKPRTLARKLRPDIYLSAHSPHQQSFLALGWNHIIADRLWALNNNLQSGFAAHGGIILFPFIIAGIIYYWKDERVKLACLAWLILFFVMTFIFPFAGARGAFFHAGAALQPMWWSLAPLGLESILLSLRKRGIGNDNNRVVFRSALIMVAMILTVYVVYLRLFTLGWGEGEDANYPVIEQFLVENGIKNDDIVIVRNAPGYYLETGRSAISIPYGGEASHSRCRRSIQCRLSRA